MATVWITYVWADNEHGDVDFMAQELERAGITVKLDRWNLDAGRRLWEQIECFICKPEQSDAWLLIASNNSLASEPCKEEFAYALDRALRSRGEAFPVIALFLTHTDPSLIPAGIRTDGQHNVAHACREPKHANGDLLHLVQGIALETGVWC